MRSLVARYRGKGPPLLRIAQQPYGLDAIPSKFAYQCLNDKRLLFTTMRLCVASILSVGFALVEHPAHTDHHSARHPTYGMPASIWKLPEMLSLAACRARCYIGSCKAPWGKVIRSRQICCSLDFQHCQDHLTSHGYGDGRQLSEVTGMLVLLHNLGTNSKTGLRSSHRPRSTQLHRLVRTTQLIRVRFEARLHSDRIETMLFTIVCFLTPWLSSLLVFWLRILL